MNAGIPGSRSLAMGAIAFSIDNIWIQLAFGVGICGVVIYYIREAFKYAHAFPHHALLEDAKLIQALRIEQAVKDKHITIDGKAEPISNPALIGHSKGKKNG